MRDAATGKIDALGPLQTVTWVRPAFDMPLNIDGIILPPARIPAAVHTFYGFIGGETGAFYLVGQDQYAEYFVGVFVDAGQQLASRVIRLTEGDAVGGPASEPFDPNSAVTLTRFDSLGAFIATADFQPPDPNDGGFGGYAIGQGGAPGALAIADRKLAIFLDGTTFAKLGTAKLSDIGLEDDLAGPPPSASGGVNSTPNGDGSVTSIGAAANDFIYSDNAPQIASRRSGDDVVVSGADRLTDFGKSAVPRRRRPARRPRRALRQLRRSDQRPLRVMLADGVGFEPTVDLHPRRFSRPVP